MRASALALVLAALRRGPEVAARERWSRDQLLAAQQRALRQLVTRVAARSSFYRQHWGGVPGPDVELAQLRPLSRGALMAHFDEAVTDPRLTRERVDRHLRELAGDPLLFHRYRVMASSGSSGEPGRFVYSPAGWDGFLDGMFRWTRWMGVRPRLPRLRLSAIGAPDARHMTYRGAASVDVGLYAAQRLPATAPLPTLVDALNRHQPEAINAYPSILALLAEEQRAGRLSIRPRVLCTSSEQRTPETTARIRDVFGVSPFDCYATTETGITALDCAYHDGLHVFEDLTIVEIVDDDDRPVAPGTLGARVLVTNLSNGALPIIRVALSDMLIERPGRCACGCVFRRLDAVEGRADDMLRLRDVHGAVRAVHPLQVRKRLDALAELVQYRVSWLPTCTRVEVIVRGDVSDGDLGVRVVRALEDLAASLSLVPPRVEVVRVASIPREGSAKLKVVRQLGA